jgi:C1q domain
MAFLPPTLRQRYFNAAGLPLAGGKIWSYAAGTTTPLPTFTDKTETTQNANPYILDANGEGQIWLSSSAYKIVLMDANDVVQWTVDNVRSAQNATFEAIQPMTTKGDLIGHTGAQAQRIPVGTDGFVLTADSPSTNGVAWALPHPLTTKGDIFTRGAAIAARLPVGSNGQFLSADSAEATGLKWVAAPGDPLTTKGDIFVRNSTISTRLPIGTNGLVLTADSAEATGMKWAAPTGSDVSAKFSTASARTINNTTPTIIYEVEAWDTHNAYNTSTGEFTCPVAGKYLISGGFTTTGTATTVGHANILRVFKNGSLDSDLASSMAQTTTAITHRGYGSAGISCAASDVLTFRFYADTASTLNSGAGSVSNHVTVMRIGP